MKLDGAYDTGKPGKGNLAPSSLALDGTADARAGGIFAMQESSVNLKTDVQVPSITAQVFMEIEAVESFDRLDFRQVFGRAGNWLGGSYYSSFTDNGTLPQSIVKDAAPAGAMPEAKVVQLQYVRLFDSGILIGAAIENPTISDFTLVNTTDVRLQRMPEFVARVRYQPIDAWGSLQFATLLRQFGYEDSSMVEHFETGVSFSVHARLRTIGYDNARFGLVAGDGSGGRIFGLSGEPIAAGPVAGSLEPLTNMGAFASYQHFWSPCLWSNVAYGYAEADLTPTMNEKTRLAQNGWANLIWNNSSGKIALGLEYQIGERETGDGKQGLNHHIQLSLQIGTGYIAPAAASAAESGLERSTAPLAPAGIFPRL